MESMTLMPTAAAAGSTGAAASFVRASQTFGAMPFAAVCGHTSSWSLVVTIENVNHPAATAFKTRTIGRKAYGTRRLGEQTST